MTKSEAQTRNWKIMQLTGILPRLSTLIPDDIRSKMQPRDLKQFESFAERLMMCMKDSKVKKFTCAKCNPIKSTANPTTNKKAYRCDFCYGWYDDIFNVSQIKEVHET